MMSTISEFEGSDHIEDTGKIMVSNAIEAIRFSNPNGNHEKKRVLVSDLNKICHTSGRNWKHL